MSAHESGEARQLFFYGWSRLIGYGRTSRILSMISVLLGFPAAVVICWPRKPHPSIEPVS